MRFEVRALCGGRIDTFVVDAADIEAAQREVVSRSLQVVSIKPAHRWWLRELHSSAHAFPTDFFVEELATLLEAGLSVVEAIETIRDKDRTPGTSQVLTLVLNGVYEGKRLSTALECIPDHIPPLLVAIVRAGERTGSLLPSLRRYALYRARLNSVRSKVSSVLVYPVILLVVGTGVTLFLLGYVVPRFASVYQGTGDNLPWLSAKLLEWGSFVGANTLAVAGALVLLAGGPCLALRHSIRKHGLLAIGQALPAFRERLMLFDLIRLYMTSGMLIDSGMPLPEALALTGGALPAGMAQRLALARQQILQGEPAVSALEQHGLTTPVGLRLLSAGESSGRLGEMLIRTADYHDTELSNWLDRFIRSFEPVLMVGIGLIIGTVVVLLYLPIFDLAGSIH